MIQCVVGFMFQDDKVALIRENGLLNGIGGHIEPGETAIAAMVREFRKETGRTVTQWRYYCYLSSPESTVSFFTCPGYLDWLETVTGGIICNINDLVDVPPNLKWLIPMALDNVQAKVEVDS